MLSYCKEGILLFIYVCLTLAINLFLFKILIKNFEKIKTLRKYKKIYQLYSDQLNKVYLLEFFEKKNFLGIKAKDLIVLGNLKIQRESFYSKLLKFEFIENL